MITVLRVEHAKGTGMYNRNSTNRSVSFGDLEYVSSIADPKHPVPEDDHFLMWDSIEYDDRRNWFFGFGSKQQLKDWTISSRVRQAMDESNFSVKVYQIDAHEDVNIGKYQAVFRKNRARYVGSFPLSAVDAESVL